MSTEQSAPVVTLRIDRKEGFLYFDGAGDYFIDLSKIKSAESILAWTVHLSRKKWATREIIESFIGKAAIEARIYLPEPY